MTRYGTEHQGCPLLPDQYVHGNLYHITTLAPGLDALVPAGSILLACNFIAEIATLCCKVRDLAQVLDSAEQELELPVCSGGCVLRNLSQEISMHG